MRTRLTDLLDIEHPVMLAGMGGVSYSELVAAVSNAGGFGCLGASAMGNDRWSTRSAQTKALTDKPFGVDLLTAAGDLTPQVEQIIKEGGRVFVAGLGVPARRRGPVPQARRARGQHVRQGPPRHARRSKPAATSSSRRAPKPAATPARSRRCRSSRRSSTPSTGVCLVVAAGGIFDGRGLAAALCLGADGVWIGTRFIATPEAMSVQGYKETLLKLGDDGTTVARAYTGKTCRVVRNCYTEYFEEHKEELQPFPGADRSRLPRRRVPHGRRPRNRRRRPGA